jgi:hypothetical protein
MCGGTFFNDWELTDGSLDGECYDEWFMDFPGEKEITEMMKKLNVYGDRLLSLGIISAFTVTSDYNNT